VYGEGISTVVPHTLCMVIHSGCTGRGVVCRGELGMTTKGYLYVYIHTVYKHPFVRVLCAAGYAEQSGLNPGSENGATLPVKHHTVHAYMCNMHDLVATPSRQPPCLYETQPVLQSPL
jgi:hypothetical protein